MLRETLAHRRTVIVSAGLGVLATVVAACSSSSKAPAGSEAASSAPADTAASSTPGAGALAKTADVPVGSGVIVSDLVITQPSAGVFKGFSAACPHAGCNVTKVTDGKIVCPCHGSKFNLDGSVDEGPASKPLESKTVVVQGDSIVAG